MQEEAVPTAPMRVASPSVGMSGETGAACPAGPGDACHSSAEVAHELGQARAQNGIALGT